MAGSVEVGGNGSVHLRVRHAPSDIQATPANGQARGRDPGKGETFTVEVVYKTPEEAQNGLNSAQVQGNRVVLTVAASNAQAPAYGAPAQVKVSW